MNLLRYSLLAALLLAVSPAALRAGLLTYTLGSAAPSFSDGQTGIATSTFNTAVGSNAAPFNGFIGSDVSGPNFSAAWAYNYAAIVETITAATLTLGLYDHDSSATGDQVAAFSVGGIDLTALLNAALEGAGGTSGEYNIYTINLPGTTFAALAAGTPGLSLDLQGPGLGILGNTDFNGAGLDYSTLSITTDTQQNNVIPEPATWMLLGTGVAAVAFRRRLGRG
jgi:hypothetical protein